jgi:YjbE family integral membrane protein
MDWLVAGGAQFLQILWLDIILSGDNAVIIGMAAAGLPAHLRARAVLLGVIAAAALRIAFSVFATLLLGIWWIQIVGGVALMYVAWGFFKELRGGAGGEESAGHGEEAQEKTLLQALGQIVLADVSMALDNVLAVAAVARDNIGMLVVGLGMSILMMGLMAGLLARLLDRYKFIAWIGLALIAYIGVELLWEGMVIANDTLQLGLPLPAPHPAAAH